MALVFAETALGAIISWYPPSQKVRLFKLTSSIVPDCLIDTVVSICFTVLITEDASVDARFASNPYVAGEPYIKFYAGAPLVGTGMHVCYCLLNTIADHKHNPQHIQIS